MARRPLLFPILAAAAWMACGDDGGSAPDTTAPTVSSVTPSDGATGVALSSDVVVSFSEPIAPGTVTPTSVALRLGAFDVPAARTLENGNQQVRINPTSSLGNNSGYVVTLTGAITDAAGNALSGAPLASDFNTITANGMVNDGTGDTFGTGGFQADLTTFSAQQGSITVVLQFSAAISRASAAQPNSVGGYLDIDIDQDGATGEQPLTDAFRPDAGSTGMGMEFFVELFDDDVTGLLTLYDALGNPRGTITPTFGPTSITFTIPNSLIANDDGNVDLAVVVGSLAEPTDIGPNAGHMTLGTSGLPIASLAGAPRPRAGPTVRAWRP